MKQNYFFPGHSNNMFEFSVLSLSPSRILKRIVKEYILKLTQYVPLIVLMVANLIPCRAVYAQILCGVGVDGLGLDSIEFQTNCEDGWFKEEQNYIDSVSYHLPVYIYILRKDDGSGGVETSSAIEAIKLAFHQFQQHNIFPYIACIQDYPSTSLYYDVHTTVFNSPIAKPDDGILIFLASEYDPSPTFLGFSVVGSRQFYAVFDSNNIIYNRRLFAHEMGHSIGLLHTYDRSKCDNNPNNQCPEYAGTDSYECEVRGDFVCDTPGDPGLYVWPPVDCYTIGNSACVDPDSNQYTNLPINNTMTDFLGVCYETAHFTPGQGKRMRHFIQTRLGQHAVQAEIQTDIDISNQQVWNEDVFVIGDITIKKGGSLTFNGINVTMNTDKQIVVEPGGRLIIDGSIVTTNSIGGNCSDGLQSENMWKGILVLGDPNFTQYQTDGDGHFRQGRLLVKNESIIEHAKTGIAVGNSFNTGGGIVNIRESSEIKNCINSIVFEQYTQFGGGYVLNNLSNCLNSSFITNDDFRGGTLHSNVWNKRIHGIKIYNCEFMNTFNGGGSGRGILSSNSYFRVDAAEENGTVFSGFLHGVETNSLFGIGPFYVRHSLFEKNKVGVYANGTNYATIIKSQFDIGNYTNEQTTQEGIYLNAGTGFIIHRNSFNGVGEAESTIGVRIKDSGANSNAVIENSFSNIARGNQAEGVNFNENEIEMGLTYICNTNSDAVETDFRTYAPGVSRTQGTLIVPAKNTFSHTSNGLPSDWWNDLGMMPIVYRCRNISAEIPNYVQNVNDQIILEERPGCPSPVIIEGPIDHPDNNLRPAVSSLKTTILNFMDGGDTESLLDDISSETGTGASQLYNDIYNLSPWVSSDVLRSISDRTDLYSEAEIFNLIWENPDALYDESLVDHLLEKSTPMSQILVDSLLTRYGAITSRTPYDDSLSIAMMELQIGITLYLHQELLDTNGMSMEHLLSIVSPVSGEFKPGDAIGAYVMTDDIEGAISYYDSIRTSPDLSLLEEQWYDEAKIFMDALDSMNQNQSTWTALEEWMIDSIYVLINNSHPWVEAMAISVLNEWFDEDYFHDPLWDEPEPQPLILSVADEISHSVNKDFMKLFPNPSKGLIQFRILENIENIYTLSIMDTKGLIKRQQEFRGAWLLDCPDCPDGWYFYRIIGMDGSMQTGKFIVVK